MITSEELAKMMHVINAWACAHKIPLVLFGIHDRKIFALDHTNCEGIPDIDDMIIKRVVKVMKDEVKSAHKELFGRDPLIAQIVNAPVTKKQN